MRTLDYCKVLLEPYVGPCYIREQQNSSRRLLLGASYEETTLNLVKDYPCYEAVFVKELAKHVEGKLDEVMQRGLSTYTHTFLIRRPDIAISYVALYGGTYLPYSTIITGYWWLFGYRLFLLSHSVVLCLLLYSFVVW